jgi:hypothetical protein
MHGERELALRVVRYSDVSVGRVNSGDTAFQKRRSGTLSTDCHKYGHSTACATRPSTILCTALP